MLRPSLLPFGFAPWFARILRETFAEKPNDAPSSLSVIKKEARPAGHTGKMPELFPADLAAFVLFLEPGHQQRFEVFHHGAWRCLRGLPFAKLYTDKACFLADFLLGLETCPLLRIR